MGRIQANSNLSCRGISSKAKPANGESLRGYALHLMGGDFGKRAEAALAESGQHVMEFETSCRDAGIYQGRERLASVGSQAAFLLGRDDGIGKLLSYANDVPEAGEKPAGVIISEIKSAKPPKELERMADETNMAQLELENPAWLPVYTDEDLGWNVFRTEKGRLCWLSLGETGSLEARKRYSTGDIGLLPRTEDALKEFCGYAVLLAGRDCFAGYACHVCAEEDYEYDLLTVYLGVLGTTMLDLWWRASLVGKIKGQDIIDGRIAREGIRAFDMDCLDAPTIGVFF
jgi:hypothetical protein